MGRKALGSALGSAGLSVAWDGGNCGVPGLLRRAEVVGKYLYFNGMRRAREYFLKV